MNTSSESALVSVPDEPKFKEPDWQTLILNAIYKGQLHKLCIHQPLLGSYITLDELYLTSKSIFRLYDRFSFDIIPNRYRNDTFMIHCSWNPFRKAFTFICSFDNCIIRSSVYEELKHVAQCI